MKLSRPIGVFVVVGLLDLEVVVIVWGGREDAPTNEGYKCLTFRHEKQGLVKQQRYQKSLD